MGAGGQTEEVWGCGRVGVGVSGVGAADDGGAVGLY